MCSSFIIVGQPTGSDGAAVTQYIKSTSGHLARLNSRIVCLLDPDILKDRIEVSKIGMNSISFSLNNRSNDYVSDVILYPLNREANNKTEKQPSIKWETRKVMTAEGVLVSVAYAEIHTLQLGKLDSVCRRLSFNSTLCQLEFRIKIKVKTIHLLIILSVYCTTR